MSEAKFDIVLTCLPNNKTYRIQYGPNETIDSLLARIYADKKADGFPNPVGKCLAIRGQFAWGSMKIGGNLGASTWTIFMLNKPTEIPQDKVYSFEDLTQTMHSYHQYGTVFPSTKNTANPPPPETTLLTDSLNLFLSRITPENAEMVYNGLTAQSCAGFEHLQQAVKVKNELQNT